MKKLLLSVFALVAGTGAYAQWTEQATGFATASRGISNIEIVDENVVWCIAYDGANTANAIQEFTRTTDGGQTWTPGIFDISNTAANINNLSPTTADIAWLSTIDSDNGGKGILFVTSDGGLNWTPANPTGPTITTPSFTAAASFQNVVHFFDENTGIVQGDPTGNGTKFEIYRTVDGGSTWAQITGGALPNALTSPAATPEFGYNGGNVSAGDFFWFVTSRGFLYRTADKGATWQKSPASPITDFGGINFTNVNGRVHFSDIDGDITHAVGILLATTDGGTNYTRYTTTDGGFTWTNQGAYTSFYQQLDFIPGSQVLVAVGVDESVNPAVPSSAYSNDFGQTWIEIDNGTQRNAVAFLNGTTGWSGGFSESTTVGGIYKYTGANLGVPTVGARPQFSVSPNPTSGMLNIANENAAIANVTVFDLLGKQVFNQKFSAVNETSVDLSSLTTGSYIVKVTADSGASQTIKIMKN